MAKARSCDKIAVATDRHSRKKVMDPVASSTQMELYAFSLVLQLSLLRQSRTQQININAWAKMYYLKELWDIFI